MNEFELKKFAVVLCEHSPSKTMLGQILELITTMKRMNLNTSCEFIYDIITLDFFYEIPGTMNDCLTAFKPEKKEMLNELLNQTFTRKANTGDLMDSDEDSEGNLK
jgi:hypothetical protein